MFTLRSSSSPREPPTARGAPSTAESQRSLWVRVRGSAFPVQVHTLGTTSQCWNGFHKNYFPPAHFYFTLPFQRFFFQLIESLHINSTELANMECTILTNQCKHTTGTNNTLTCMEDGLWSFPEALCELRCPAPPAVPNAVLQTKRCNETGLKVGTLCKYKCKPGYHVANKPKR